MGEFRLVVEGVKEHAIFETLLSAVEVFCADPDCYELWTPEEQVELRHIQKAIKLKIK